MVKQGMSGRMQKVAYKKHSNFSHNFFQGGESPMVTTQQLLNLLWIFLFFFCDIAKKERERELYVERTKQKLGCIGVRPSGIQ